MTTPSPSTTPPRRYALRQGGVVLSTHDDQRAAIAAAKALATVAYYERGERPVLWHVFLVDGRVLKITKS